MELGVCYYPEHWPREWWEDDARKMVAMGISQVRIAEFCWSRIEASPGQFTWAWLDDAVEVLAAAGLKIIMCTPTATPPKWLIDRSPEILALGADGRPRTFGSRRHYDFSSDLYLEESRRISTLFAQRYGQHPAIVAWQPDNEYGCHDTILSYSPNALQRFRLWLKKRYGTIAALNGAWGTVFWSAEYRSFDEVDAPTGTVTEAFPTHRLDFQRFASDQVVRFNRMQCEVIREHSPGRDITHNFMGFFTDFDHHDVAADLDFSTWDSYPLGFTQMFFLDAKEKQRYAFVGHPDIPAFHHDLYRGLHPSGRWGVMEQQPGPVNWATWNPAPLNGVVRLWSWQAFAHGAELVSYFRWRQAPFAQEQMHAGLNRPDRSLDQGGIEAGQVGKELNELAVHLQDMPAPRGGVALVFDYQSIWMARIQPQGQDYNALELSFRLYSALRCLGLDVDIVPASRDLSGYAMVVLPAQLREVAALAVQLASSSAQIVFAPRSGAKTEDFAIPEQLPPGIFSRIAGVKVLRVSSLPPGMEAAIAYESGSTFQVSRWREDIACAEGAVRARFADGMPAITCTGRARYVAGWLDHDGWLAVLASAALDAGLATERLPDDVRTSHRGDYVFVSNFSQNTVAWAPQTAAECLLGGKTLAPMAVSIWKVQSSR